MRRTWGDVGRNIHTKLPGHSVACGCVWMFPTPALLSHARGRARMGRSAKTSTNIHNIHTRDLLPAASADRPWPPPGPASGGGRAFTTKAKGLTMNDWTGDQFCPRCGATLDSCDWCTACGAELFCAQALGGLDRAVSTVDRGGRRALVLAEKSPEDTATLRNASQAGQPRPYRKERP